ncbi:hypothetical protein YTPLAS18_15220 [Nitrospira sp.]|nr:hypothetical protein YTPLAS18_15220 [Nitrospira sp.]
MQSKQSKGDQKQVRPTWVVWLVLGGLLTGCSTIPVAEGTHKALPRAGSLVVVWSNHSTAEQVAIMWLQM